MIFAFFFGIFDEEYIVDESEKCVAYLVVFVVLLLCSEVVNHFALSVKLFFEFVAAISYAIEEYIAHFVGEFAEEIVQEVVHNIWSGLKIYINPEIVVVT